MPQGNTILITNQVLGGISMLEIDKNFKRKKNGQFVKGDPVLSENSRRFNSLLKGVPKTAEHKRKIGVANTGLVRTEEMKMKQREMWKGITKNTGRTHFEKGHVPHNYKGGISKTVEYRSFYKAQYKLRKKNAPGAHTIREWRELKAQYNWTCPCCNKSEPDIKLGEDHIIPLTKGGSNDISNIQPLCMSCNSRKFTKIKAYERSSNI